MKGRYYSPLWHRFVNSDQGVDPMSLNQFAYVNGMPFMATDPSGMKMICFSVPYADDWGYAGPVYYDSDGNAYATQIIGGGTRYRTFCFGLYDGDGGGGDSGGGGGGGSGGAGGSGNNGESGHGDESKDAKEPPKTDCEKYVDALLQSASNYREKYPMTGSLRFGRALFKSRNDWIANSFGLVSKNPNGGYTGGYTGFKDELVGWGQEIGVYKHITASLGLSLQGAFILIAGQTVFDDLLKYLGGDLEGLAEMYGNRAGILLAPSIEKFFLTGGQAEKIKESMMNILCAK
jgi:hypothetical protein